MIMVVLCNQSIGQISAILFTSNVKLAIMASQILLCFSLVMSNILFPVRRLHYSIHYLSEFCYLRLTFDSFATALYGFDRCLENEISIVLYEMGISGHMFWQKIIYLILICIALKLFTVLLLIFKINFQLEDNRKLNKVKNKLIDNSKIGFITF